MAFADGWRAVVDTDWYPASYPWHCVIELDQRSGEVHIAKGEPICRLFLVKRDAYFASEMSTDEFERFFRFASVSLSKDGVPAQLQSDEEGQESSPDALLSVL